MDVDTVVSKVQYTQKVMTLQDIATFDDTVTHYRIYIKKWSGQWHLDMYLTEKQETPQFQKGTSYCFQYQERGDGNYLLLGFTEVSVPSKKCVLL